MYKIISYKRSRNKKLKGENKEEKKEAETIDE